jgi:hypothetical protein
MDPDNTVSTYGAAGGKELGPLVQHLHNDTFAKGESLGRRVGELYMQRWSFGFLNEVFNTTTLPVCLTGYRLSGSTVSLTNSTCHHNE